MAFLSVIFEKIRRSNTKYYITSLSLLGSPTFYLLLGSLPFQHKGGTNLCDAQELRSPKVENRVVLAVFGSPTPRISIYR